MDTVLLLQVLQVPQVLQVLRVLRVLSLMSLLLRLSLQVKIHLNLKSNQDEVQLPY